MVFHLKIPMKNFKKDWPIETTRVIKELYLILSLNNRNWHELKNNPDRRAAELLVSALAQIVNKGKKEDVVKLIEQSLKWVKNEVKDPGCPSH